MSHYDFFAARLKCPHCGTISAEDASTELHTYIRDPLPGAAVGGLLRVGDFLSDVEDFVEFYEGANYVCIQEPDWRKEIHILQWWACTGCRNLDNWAEIVILRHGIQSISATRLTRNIFERSHFIHEADAKDLAARLRGCSYRDLIKTGADVLQTLREQLAQSANQ